MKIFVYTSLVVVVLSACRSPRVAAKYRQKGRKPQKEDAHRPPRSNPDPALTPSRAQSRPPTLPRNTFSSPVRNNSFSTSRSGLSNQPSGASLSSDLPSPIVPRRKSPTRDTLLPHPISSGTFNNPQCKSAANDSLSPAPTGQPHKPTGQASTIPYFNPQAGVLYYDLPRPCFPGGEIKLYISKSFMKKPEKSSKGSPKKRKLTCSIGPPFPKTISLHSDEPRQPHGLLSKNLCLRVEKSEEANIILTKATIGQKAPFSSAAVFEVTLTLASQDPKQVWAFYNNRLYCTADALEQFR